MWALVGQYTEPFSLGDVTKHPHTPRPLAAYADEGESKGLQRFAQDPEARAV